MKYVIPVICAAVSAALVFILMFKSLGNQAETFQEEKLRFAEQTLNKRLEEYKIQIEKQLEGFSEAVSSNRTFTLRLLVEKDNSSADITELAS
ncbi:MAG: hypothetical protein Q4F84_07135, partial [Fibrobacter sp.]|nr:hypothetical protein [Fibrobacter sp.]